MATPKLKPGTGGDWFTLDSTLRTCLSEAEQGVWTQMTPEGSYAPNYPFNSNIMNAFNQVGFSKELIDDIYPGGAANQPGDRVYWCAAFAGLVLKLAGCPYLNSVAAASYSQAWKGCTRVSVDDPSLWRKHDVILIKKPNHITFLDSIYTGNNKAYCTGGNQGDSVCTTGFSVDRVTFVGRYWEVPPLYDVPVFTNINPEPGGETNKSVN